MGMEHSVANMYFIPAALLNPEVNLENTAITWGNFIINNLIPVTAGNIVGGTILVGLVYWFVFLRKSQTQ